MAGSCDPYIYGCIRGLGVWKIDEQPVTFDPQLTTSTLCYMDNTGQATVSISNAAYQWSNGQATQTANGLTIGTYTVTVTTGGGCTRTASVTIAQDPYCCNGFTQYLHQSDFDNGNITGDWNLNEDVVCSLYVNIGAAHISVREGVSITVLKNASLYVHDASTFESCGNMWKGIIVNDGGSLTFNESQLSDAQYGVHLINNAEFITMESTYSRNYVDLYIDGTNSLSLATPTLTIWHNFFTSDWINGIPLKHGYHGQVPPPLTNTFAGILAKNAIFNLNSVYGINQVVGQYRGMSLSNCFVTVKNTGFWSMPFQNEYVELPGDAGGGIGIYADMSKGGSIEQTGLGTDFTSTTSFAGCYKGVMTKGGTVALSNNKMTQMVSGIECSDVIAQSISITYNDIYASKKGVTLNSNDYANYIGVKYNNIYVDGATARGISVSEFNSATANRRFNIDCNTITVNDGIDGIFLNAAGSVAIQQNNVNLNS